MWRPLGNDGVFCGCIRSSTNPYTQPVGESLPKSPPPHDAPHRGCSTFEFHPFLVFFHETAMLFWSGVPSPKSVPCWYSMTGLVELPT